MSLRVAALLLGVAALSPAVSAEPELLDSLTRAAAFLTVTQDADGSWPALRGRERDLSDGSATARVFPVAGILMSLKGTPLERSPLSERARGYLRAQMEEGWVWSGDGRKHTLTNVHGALPCWLDPDTEDTALALMLLGGGHPPTAEARSLLRELFARQQAPDGLYRTYIQGFYADASCPTYDSDNAPSFGVNLHLLPLFERLDWDAAGLATALRKRMSRSGFPSDEIYYQSNAVLAQHASNAVELGSLYAEALLERLVERDRVGPEREESVYVIAARAKAVCHLCRMSPDTCELPRAEVRQLLEAQGPDGAWPAAPVYSYRGAVRTLVEALNEPDQRGQLREIFVGSRAESTALAYKALHLYQSLQALDPQPQP